MNLKKRKQETSKLKPASTFIYIGCGIHVWNIVLFVFCFLYTFTFLLQRSLSTLINYKFHLSLARLRMTECSPSLTESVSSAVNHLCSTHTYVYKRTHSPIIFHLQGESTAEKIISEMSPCCQRSAELKGCPPHHL